MIPQLNLTAWSAHAPWPELRQVERDLIIARAIVAIFSDPVLATELQVPRRDGASASSTSRGAAALFRGYRSGAHHARTDRPPFSIVCAQSSSPGSDTAPSTRVGSPQLHFRTPSEEDAAVEIRLKIEINTSETDAYDPPPSIAYAVDNSVVRWPGHRSPPSRARR